MVSFLKLNYFKKASFRVANFHLIWIGRGGIRTHDLILKRDLLYRLSYTPTNVTKYILIHFQNAIIINIFYRKTPGLQTAVGFRSVPILLFNNTLWKARNNINIQTIISRYFLKKLLYKIEELNTELIPNELSIQVPPD